MAELGLGSWPVMRVDEGGVTIEGSCSCRRDCALSDSVEVDRERSLGVEV